MASRKSQIYHDHNGSYETERESRFQESGLILTTTQHSRRKQRGYGVTACCICYLFIIVSLVAILLGITLGARFSGRHTPREFSVTLGDTVLVPFQNYWCRDIQMDSSSELPLEATLYLMYEKPNRSTRNKFKIDNSFMMESEVMHPELVHYVSWRFYLYSKSSFLLMDACVQSDGVGQFLIIQGEDKFIQWTKGQKVPNRGSIALSACSSGGGTQIYFSIDIDTDDDYYFVFTSTDSFTPPRLEVTMMFNRLEYTPVIGLSSPNCTIGTIGITSCSIPNQFSTYNFGLVVVSEKSTQTYGQYTKVNYTCMPRASSYMIIFFVPLSAVVVGCFVGVVLWFRWRRAKRLTARTNRTLTQGYQSSVRGSHYSRLPSNQLPPTLL